MPLTAREYKLAIQCRQPPYLHSLLHRKAQRLVFHVARIILITRVSGIFPLDGGRGRVFRGSGATASQNLIPQQFDEYLSKNVRPVRCPNAMRDLCEIGSILTWTRLKIRCLIGFETQVVVLAKSVEHAVKLEAALEAATLLWQIRHISVKNGFVWITFEPFRFTCLKLDLSSCCRVVFLPKDRFQLKKPFQAPRVHAYWTLSR